MGCKPILERHSRVDANAWCKRALRDANTNGFDFFTFKTSTDSNVLAHIPHLCGAPVTDRTEKYNTEKLSTRPSF